MKLRAGELAAALRSLEANLFPGGDAMEGSFELSEVLPDGSTRTIRGGDPSLFEAVCTLGFDGHDLGITWSGERERYLALAVRGSRGLRRVGPSLEQVPSILIQASSHDPALMYGGLDGFREALGLRELEPEPESATRPAALVAVSVVPDLTSGERNSARRAGLSRSRGRASEPGIRREHVKGLWALVAAVVSAIAAVIGAYLLKK